MSYVMRPGEYHVHYCDGPNLFIWAEFSTLGKMWPPDVILADGRIFEYIRNEAQPEGSRFGGYAKYELVK